jgi:hypothetical protein
MVVKGPNAVASLCRCLVFLTPYLTPHEEKAYLIDLLCSFGLRNLQIPVRVNPLYRRVYFVLCSDMTESCFFCSFLHVARKANSSIGAVCSFVYTHFNGCRERGREFFVHRCAMMSSEIYRDCCQN